MVTDERDRKASHDPLRRTASGQSHVLTRDEIAVCLARPNPCPPVCELATHLTPHLP